MPLHKTLFAETSPSPAKYCLARMGKIAPDLRLPMIPVSKATEKLLDDAMTAVGVRFKK